MLNAQKIKQCKKMFSALLIALSVTSSQFSVFALNADDLSAAPTDNITVDSCSSSSAMTDTIPLGQDVHYTYEMLVNDEIVEVSVSNERVMKGREPNVGSGQFDVVSGQSYIYTLTNSPLHSGTGSFTYTVYYTIGSPISSDKDQYRINVTSVTLSGSAPSGFSLGNSNAYVAEGNGNIIVSTKGNISFTRVVFSDLNYTISVKLSSCLGSYIQIDHIVTW